MMRRPGRESVSSWQRNKQPKGVLSGKKKKAKQGKKGGQADDGKDDKDSSSGDDAGADGEVKGLEQADLD